jgi:glycosyltransferase involved in cell wall biosynthesis
MKLLVVGHAYLSAINKKKWEVYAQVHTADEVTVVTPSYWKDALFSLSAQKEFGGAVAFLEFPVANQGNEVLHRYAWTDVWRVVKTVQPDVLLVEQGLNAFSYFQFILVCLLQGVKIPFLFFTWVNWRHAWGWKYRLFWSFIERFNRFFSTAALVGNPEAEKLLREDGFSGPVLVGPQLGVDRCEEVVVVTKKRIGFLGRLTSEKGVHTLIHAFAQILSSESDLQLLIVGSGKEESNLKQLVQSLEVTENVLFTGSVDHYRAMELVKTLSVLVLPSLDIPTWREQFGHVLIEAMSFGIPVVGSDAGAIPWVIKDGGLVFEQGNVDNLAHKLRLLLHDMALRNECIVRAKKLIDEEYSHEAVARKIGAFLHEVVMQKDRQAGV